MPGPVSHLIASSASNTSFDVMWNEPERPNGIIQSYNVSVYNVKNNCTMGHDNMLNVSVVTMSRHIVILLGKTSGI